MFGQCKHLNNEISSQTWWQNAKYCPVEWTVDSLNDSSRQKEWVRVVLTLQSSCITKPTDRPDQVITLQQWLKIAHHLTETEHLSRLNNGSTLNIHTQERGTWQNLVLGTEEYGPLEQFLYLFVLNLQMSLHYFIWSNYFFSVNFWQST